MTRDLVIEVDEGKPSWVSTSGRRQIIELITSALKEASITDKVGLRFSTEANVRSRVMPPMTLALNVGRSGVPNSACVVAAAEDARNDLCAVLITGSQMQMDKFRAFMGQKKRYVMPPVRPELDKLDRLKQPPEPVFHPEPPPPPPESGPVIGDDELAIYLDHIREAGGTVTFATMKALAMSYTGSHEIVQASLMNGLMAQQGQLYEITMAGIRLMQRLLAPASPSPPPPPPPPPVDMEAARYETLRQAVIVSRQRWEAAHRMHEPVRQERELLTQELTQSSTHLTSVKAQLDRVISKLAECQTAHDVTRDNVLRLEGRLRELPDDTAMQAARREMDAAKKAYDEFVKLD